MYRMRCTSQRAYSVGGVETRAQVSGPADAPADPDTAEIPVTPTSAFGRGHSPPRPTAAHERSHAHTDESSQGDLDHKLAEVRGVSRKQRVGERESPQRVDASSEDDEMEIRLYTDGRPMSIGIVECRNHQSLFDLRRLINKVPRSHHCLEAHACIAQEIGSVPPFVFMDRKSDRLIDRTQEGIVPINSIGAKRARPPRPSPLTEMTRPAAHHGVVRISAAKGDTEVLGVPLPPPPALEEDARPPAEARPGRPITVNVRARVAPERS
jgi:hypothetical protein